MKQIALCLDINRWPCYNSVYFNSWKLKILLLSERDSKAVTIPGSICNRLI